MGQQNYKELCARFIKFRVTVGVVTHAYWTHRINKMINMPPWYTIALRNSAGGWSIPQVCQRGGWARFEFNCERALMYVYSYSCLLELRGNLGWTSTTEPPAFEAPVLMAHNTWNGNMPHNTSLVPSLALLSLRSWTLSGRDMQICLLAHTLTTSTQTHTHTHTPTKSCYPIKEGTWKTKVLAVGKIKILKTEIL